MTTEGLTLMEEIRNLCDSAETHIDNNFWPYPRYRELLLIFSGPCENTETAGGKENLPPAVPVFSLISSRPAGGNLQA